MAFEETLVVICVLDDKIKMKQAVHSIVKVIIVVIFLGIFIGLFALFYLLK